MNKRFKPSKDTIIAVLSVLTIASVSIVALQENDCNTWISFLGAGDNVIELALKICRDYDIDLYIVLDRSPFIYPEEYTFEINGKIYKDADFMDVMCDVLYEEGEYDD